MDTPRGHGWCVRSLSGVKFVDNTLCFEYIYQRVCVCLYVYLSVCLCVWSLPELTVYETSRCAVKVVIPVAY